MTESPNQSGNRMPRAIIAPIAWTPPLAPINGNFSWENIYYTIDQKQSNQMQTKKLNKKRDLTAW